MVIKRVIAYFIDILLVTFAASMLASISYLNPQLEKYNRVYNEYSKFYEEYTENMDNIKTDDISKYKTEIDNFNYDLTRNNLYGATISIVLTIIYFAVFQKYNNGQTLGKKLMKIKIDDNLSLTKYLIRTFILHNVLINGLKIILILILSREKYILANDILYVIALLIEATIIVMVALRQDNRGLHDLIVNSNVVPKDKEIIIKKEV